MQVRPRVPRSSSSNSRANARHDDDGNGAHNGCCCGDGRPCMVLLGEQGEDPREACVGALPADETAVCCVGMSQVDDWDATLEGRAGRGVRGGAGFVHCLAGVI